MNVPRRTADKPSLADMMRILDVARELRRQRQTAARQFDRAAERAQLRQHLMDAARHTGDDTTEAEIDAAIELYYANLHTYQDPPWGWRVALAHVYIRRNFVLAAVAVIGLLVAWWLLS